MSGIHCLVFAHDRAMQLDAFLRSATRFTPYESVTVLMHNWSEGIHAESAYDIEHEHPNPAFVHAHELEPTVREWLNDHGQVVFHTDDDIFFAHAYTPPLSTLPLIFSYRLGWNTTYSHPLQRAQAAPASRPWRWRDAEGDFGYPLSINATVYRNTDLLPLLDFSFRTPTEFESGLAARAGRLEREWMSSQLHSCCVSLPHNVVSPTSTCPRGSNPEWQADALCEKYLDGIRIDLDAMDFSTVTGAHQEIPFAFTESRVNA